MKLLNLGLFGITYTKQLITTYGWHCQKCGVLKSDEVKMFDDIFDNHFCKKCNNEALLTKTTKAHHKIQLLTIKQLKQLKIFLSW